MVVIKADSNDIDAVGRLYDELCDYLSEHVNYPGWVKNIYPTRSHAQTALKENALYVAKDRGTIVGAVILCHVPENGYQNVKWLTESNYEKIYVVYTLAVHPEYFGKGVGEKLLDFAQMQAKNDGCISLRLDVVEGNIPAQKLYKKCGFTYVGTTGLGYEEYGLDRFDLYEKIL